MSGKMKMGWDFHPEHGFSKSCGGGVQVKGYMRGGPVRKAMGGKVGKSFPAAKVPTPTVGEKGPDLNVKFPGNHLAFAEGGHYASENSEPNESQKGFSHKEPEQGEPLEARKGGKIHKAMGGMARPTGMPRAAVIGMKRQRHAPSMGGGGQGMGRPAPGIPGLPQGGTASFGQQPMKPKGMASGMGSMGGMAHGMKTGGHHKK